MIKYSCQVTPHEYTTFGGPLPVDSSYTIWYHLHNFSEDLDRYHQIIILANAFGEWERYMWPIRFQSTRDPQRAQWHIYWVGENDIIHLRDGQTMDSKFKFSQNENTLAVQYASPNLLLLLNDTKDYSAATAGPTTYDLHKVLVHEIAHGLGLGHTNKIHGKGDIMLPYYDPRNTITIDSIRGIYDVHGAVIKKAIADLPHLNLLHGSTPAQIKADGCLPKLFQRWSI